MTTRLPDQSIPAALARMAETRAAAGAIRGPGGALTYADLWARARSVAGSVGGGEDPVAILMTHDVGQVTTLLGVLTAGRPAVILDPEAPRALLRALLAGSGAPLIVADDAHLDQATDLQERGRVIAAGEALAARPSAVTEVDPGRPALLAYTSGTSGDPKAAVVPHRQLIHLVRGASAALRITAADTLPMLFPISLAVAAYPLFIPLLTGGTLATFDLRGEGLAEVPSWLSREGVTVAYLAPTVVRFLEAAIGGTGFPDLRLVVLGGERVDHSDVALVRRLFGDHIEVACGYGTTETGVLAFWHAASDAGDHEGALPAGHPIEGMELAVTRPDGRALPTGETGEIVVRSPYIFTGYWNRPDLDAQVLSAGHATGTATYRTGDLGRLTPDGCLELAGRVDTQVKVRGHRVVLGEVEEALLGLDAVRDAAVTTRAGPAGATDLVAHVARADGSELTADGLRRQLGARVPAAMVPATIVLHDTLPQLPNGKLDRRALEEDLGRRPDLATPYSAPHEGLEADLAEIWEDLLGLSHLGRDDGFFDLGGYSLLAAQMLIRVETDLGQRLPMTVMLDATTIARLAAAIEQGAGQGSHSSTVVTIQAGDPGRRPLLVTHDLHGSAFRFRHLAAALGPDQPVLGFESPYLTGEAQPYQRAEDLARRYVDDLLAAVPDGPYQLCGFSFGGVVAFEMARLLRAAGRPVGLLAVVDVGPGYRGVGYSRRRPPPYPDFGHPTVLHRLGLDQRVLPRRWRRQLADEGRVAADERLWWAWHEHWLLAGPDWAARPYDGPLVLFWASDTDATDDTQGWADFVPSIEVERLDIDHDHVMDEANVGLLAGPLRERLTATP